MIETNHINQIWKIHFSENEMQKAAECVASFQVLNTTDPNISISVNIDRQSEIALAARVLVNLLHSLWVYVKASSESIKICTKGNIGSAPHYSAEWQKGWIMDGSDMGLMCQPQARVEADILSVAR